MYFTQSFSRSYSKGGYGGYSNYNVGYGGGYGGYGAGYGGHGGEFSVQISTTNCDKKVEFHIKFMIRTFSSNY